MPLIKRMKLLIIHIIFVASILPVGAQDIAESTSIYFPTARTAAIGGAHVALADDLTSLFSNPAGFRNAGPELSFAEATAGLAGPVFNIATVVVRSISGVDIQQLVGSSAVQSLLRNLYTSVNLVGPIAFGYVGGGLGFGFFNKTGVLLSTVGVIPTIYADVEESFQFSGGYSFRIPISAASKSNLDIGALIKTFVKGKVSLTKSVLELFSLFQEPSLDVVLDQDFLLETGIGIDVGILFSLFDVFYVGIVGKNLYAPTITNDYTSLQAFLDSAAPDEIKQGIVPMDLSCGFAFTPSLGFLDWFISDLKLLLDYEDILDFLTHPTTSTNPILHLGVGLEVSFLEIMALRGGFYQGLFALGIGLDLSYFELNTAMFGRELSAEPGIRPVYNLLMSVEFKTGL